MYCLIWIETIWVTWAVVVGQTAIVLVRVILLFRTLLKLWEYDIETKLYYFKFIFHKFELVYWNYIVYTLYMYIVASPRTAFE